MGDMKEVKKDTGGTENEGGIRNDSKNFHAATAAQKTEVSGLDSASVKPLRTLVGDISSIIKDQHLSNSALNILDKKLREEIETYERSGGDRRIAEILKTTSLENVVTKPEPRTFTHIPHLENRSPIASGVEEKINDIPPPSYTTPTPPKTRVPYVPTQTPPHETHRELLPTPKEEDSEEAARMILEKHRETEALHASEVASQKEARKRKERELTDEEEKLRGETRLLEEAIAVIPQMRTRDEEAMRKPSALREELIQRLASIHEEEKRAETEELHYEEIESRSTRPEERQKAEINRARAGDLREAAERKRFEIDEKIAQIGNELDTKTKALAALEENEKKLRGELAGIAARRTTIQKERAWFGLRERIAEIAKLKESIEMNWIVLNEKKKEVEKSLAPVLSHERELEEKKHNLETKEASASGPAARHQIESERWEIERERRKVEEERWKLEREIETTKRPMRELGAKYQKLLEEEERITEELRTTPGEGEYTK